MLEEIQLIQKCDVNKLIICNDQNDWFSQLQERIIAHMKIVIVLSLTSFQV